MEEQEKKKETSLWVLLPPFKDFFEHFYHFTVSNCSSNPISLPVLSVANPALLLLPFSVRVTQVFVNVCFQGREMISG